MPRNVADILHDCHLLTEVEDRGFQRLATIAQLRKFGKGQLIFREQDECPGVYIVGSGLVRVFKTATAGKEHVLHMVNPGGTFAEVAAIGGFHCPASAEAVASTTCALLPMEPFRRALREDHELCLGMMTGLTLWVRHLVGLLEDVVLRDAAGRVARFLLEAPSNTEGLIELPSLKRHVASHLNLTSETLSRTLRRLSEARLIDQPDTSRLILLEPEKLRLVAKGMFPRI